MLLPGRAGHDDFRAEFRHRQLIHGRIQFLFNLAGHVMFQGDTDAPAVPQVSDAFLQREQNSVECLFKRDDCDRAVQAFLECDAVEWFQGREQFPQESVERIVHHGGARRFRAQAGDQLLTPQLGEITD